MAAPQAEVAPDECLAGGRRAAAPGGADLEPSAPPPLGPVAPAAREQLRLDGAEWGAAPVDDFGSIAVFAPARTTLADLFRLSRRPLAVVLRHPVEPGLGLCLLRAEGRAPAAAAAAAIAAALGLDGGLGRPSHELYAAVMRGDPQALGPLEAACRCSAPSLEPVSATPSAPPPPTPSAPSAPAPAPGAAPSGAAPTPCCGGQAAGCAAGAEATAGAAPAAGAAGAAGEAPAGAPCGCQGGASGAFSASPTTDDCPICFSAIEPAEAAMRCSGECGRHHYFHRGCMQQWIEQCRAGTAGATCPICRGAVQFHAQRLEQFLEDADSASLPDEDRTFLMQCAERLRRGAGDDWGEVFTLENAKRWGGIAAAGGWGFTLGFAQPPLYLQDQLVSRTLSWEHTVAQGVGYIVGALARIFFEHRKEEQRRQDERKRRPGGREPPRAPPRRRC